MDVRRSDTKQGIADSTSAEPSEAKPPAPRTVAEPDPKQVALLLEHAFLGRRKDGEPAPGPSVPAAQALTGALVLAATTVHNGNVDPRALAAATAGIIEKSRALGPEQKPVYVTDPSQLALELERAYKEGLYDENMRPIVLADTKAQPVGRIENGDVVFCFNYRTDRPRQLMHALADADFPHFERVAGALPNLGSMTQYDAALAGKVQTVIADVVTIEEPLDEALARAGVTSLKVAESDKAPHVTKFMRGLRDEPYANEVVRIIPSKPIRVNYAEVPQMSYKECVDAALELVALPGGRVPQSVENGAVVKSKEGEVASAQVNANAQHLTINLPIDQVGHSGDLKAATESCEALDRELGRLVEGLEAKGFRIIITADHGNVEEMVNRDGSPNTEHSTNPVPFIFIDPSLPKERAKVALKSGRSLADVAPTLLALRGMKPPQAMSGESLFVDYRPPPGGAAKTAVIVLDGFGLSPRSDDPSDPTRLARMPNLSRYRSENGSTALAASEQSVGLRPGTMGNSEVGHMAIGAGRVVKQSLVRIDELIDPKSGTFGEESGAIIEGIRRARREGRALHLWGLGSEGQVHSSLSHLYAILRTAKREGVGRVFIHVATDGRDAPRDAGADYLREIQRAAQEIGVGTTVTVMGRFWMLDRNQQYDRTFRAYNTLLTGSDLPPRLVEAHQHD